MTTCCAFSYHRFELLNWQTKLTRSVPLNIELARGTCLVRDHMDEWSLSPVHNMHGPLKHPGRAAVNLMGAGVVHRPTSERKGLWHGVKGKGGDFMHCPWPHVFLLLYTVLTQSPQTSKIRIDLSGMQPLPLPLLRRKAGIHGKLVTLMSTWSLLKVPLSLVEKWQKCLFVTVLLTIQILLHRL